MHTAFCRLFSYLATTSFLLVYLSIMTDIVRTLRCTSRSICADFIVLSDNYRFSVSHFLPPFRFKLLCCFLQNFLEQLCLAPELLFNTYTQKKDVLHSHDSGGTPIPEKDHANRVRLYRQTHSKQVDLFLCTLAFS